MTDVCSQPIMWFLWGWVYSIQSYSNYTTPQSVSLWSLQTWTIILFSLCPLLPAGPQREEASTRIPQTHCKRDSNFGYSFCFSAIYLFIHLFIFIKKYFFPPSAEQSPKPWCSALCHPVGIHVASSVTLWAISLICNPPQLCDYPPPARMVWGGLREWNLKDFHKLKTVTWTFLALLHTQARLPGKRGLGMKTPEKLEPRLPTAVMTGRSKKVRHR